MVTKTALRDSSSDESGLEVDVVYTYNYLNKSRATGTGAISHCLKDIVLNSKEASTGKNLVSLRAYRTSPTWENRFAVHFATAKAK